MKFVLLIMAGMAAVAAGCVLLRRILRGPGASSPSGRASIMDAEPERMSLFSADHVRMLSDAQLDALEQGEEEPR